MLDEGVVTIYLGDIEDPGKKEWFRMTHAEGTIWICQDSPGRQAQKDLHKSQQPLFNDFRIL